jgi:hypothetical protein
MFPTTEAATVLPIFRVFPGCPKILNFLGIKVRGNFNRRHKVHISVIEYRYRPELQLGMASCEWGFFASRGRMIAIPSPIPAEGIAILINRVSLGQPYIDG